MTSEQRLDRLERIAKLLVLAGVRARSQFRDQIGILIDAKMRNEARFERNEQRFEQLTEVQIKLTESQIHTDRRLDALIDIVRQVRAGDASPN
jgi:uncharacterized protein related to proFAR isomerase